MALAFLCSRLKRYDPDVQIVDHPVGTFRATIIDHGLREGSRREASAVSMALQELRIPGDIYALSWDGVLGQYQHPSELPNVESIARKLRYQKLGQVCGEGHVNTLLFAHHEDDQYETVLMRLLQGHGARGLRGMKRASDIPECEGIHRVYQSGYVDSQMRKSPFYSSRISRAQSKYLRRDMRREMRSRAEETVPEEEPEDCTHHGLSDYDFTHLYQHEEDMAFRIPELDVEDGGVMVYRPLLGFSKDRLIATCEANNIPWWEDSTNQDSTLTMRNAVRHVCKTYTLPVALQKRSILALSRRCEQRARALEAEAGRLLKQAVIHDVEPAIGSALVQFPDYSPCRFPRDTSPSRRHARTGRQREIAALLIRRIIALVTPEAHLVPLANLQKFVSRLFPALPDPTEGLSIIGRPKAFVIAGVHFNPVESSQDETSPTQPAPMPTVWYLSRTPYPSDRPVPHFRASFWAPPTNDPEMNAWSRWTHWTLWDGRFWIRLSHRLPYRIIVQPFLRDHAKAFRALLSPEDRDHLALFLKRYAPGKTRFTLPALYLEEDLDLNSMQTRPYYPIPPVELDCIQDVVEKGTWENVDPTSRHPRDLDVSKMKLIALPSLGIQAPGLDHWLRYIIRYRRIDQTTLATAGTFYRAPYVPPPPWHRRSSVAIPRWRRARFSRIRRSMGVPERRRRAWRLVLRGRRVNM